MKLLLLYVALAAAVVFGVFYKLGENQRHAVEAVQAHAQAVETTTAVGAAKAVQGVVVKATARDNRTTSIHTENSHAILSRPSAALPAGSDADADAWRAGLCMYDSTAGDPACAGVR